MPRAAADSTAPRRSALQQRRSQNTRRKLIRSALELWNDRGFDEAFEATTAEEIARLAGVSKGTFYFHFAHKEDILLEMPWATAEIMVEEARGAVKRGEPAVEVIEALVASLARRVARAPRAALLRVTGHWARISNGIGEGPRGFGEAFDLVLRYGCERGELPGELEVDDIASLLQASTMDALMRWASTEQSAAALARTLSRRTRVILRGAAATTA